MQDKARDFQKKRFTVQSFLTGTARFVRNLPNLVRAKRADRVSDQFAEKIMLAVTAVNDCQYCTRYHTDLARETGIDQSTIDDILETDVGTAVDEYERPALLFAQHYAEANERPGETARAKLRAAYGRETATDILAFIRAIYFGNLLGNSYDAVRFALARHAQKGKRTVGRVADCFRQTARRVRERCPV